MYVFIKLFNQPPTYSMDIGLLISYLIISAESYVCLIIFGKLADGAIKNRLMGQVFVKQ